MITTSFKQPPAEIQPNTWYHGLRCVNCNHSMAVAANPDGAHSKIKFPNVMVEITCDRCQHESKYDAAAARPFKTGWRQPFRGHDREGDSM